MEHRLSQRVTARFEVTVRYKQNQVINGTAANISQEGLFVESEAVTLPAGTCAKLHFYLPLSSPAAILEVPAMVVHSHRCGMGMMFGSLNPAYHQALEQFIEQRLQAKALQSSRPSLAPAYSSRRGI